MADQRVVRKNLAGKNDILFGRRQVEQTRAGGSYLIDAVALQLPVTTEPTGASVNPEEFPEVVYYSGTAVVLYKYDASAEEFTIRGVLGGAYTTDERLALPVAAVGISVFDTDLGKPMWVSSLDPITWVDATGA